MERSSKAFSRSMRFDEDGTEGDGEDDDAGVVMAVEL